ncbi:putative E3 ubiquitin-protein ligase XBAT35 isoform X1 [Tanacetum coccineum]
MNDNNNNRITRKDTFDIGFDELQLYDVAKTFIELGANVNAYRPGCHAGTTFHHVAKRVLEQMVKLLLFHHVAKRGLEQMVKLLLINGVMNDDRQTALDVARVKGYSNVVHAIELLELKFVEAPEDQTSVGISKNSFLYFVFGVFIDVKHIRTWITVGGSALSMRQLFKEPTI